MSKKEVIKKEEITEKKKDSNNTCLDIDKQDKIKTISKIIYILARIFRVLIPIGIVVIGILMIVTPVVVKNIKFENDSVDFFGEKLTYQNNGDDVGLYLGDAKIGTLAEDEKVLFDQGVQKLSETNMTKLFCYMELSLAFTIAVVIFTYFIFCNVEKLFVNIHDKSTPFIEDNLEFLRKIAKYSLISVIISFVCEILFTSIFSSSIMNFSLSEVVLVLVLYVITYIFEYACILQNKSKNTMYDNNI